MLIQPLLGLIGAVGGHAAQGDTVLLGRVGHGPKGRRRLGDHAAHAIAPAQLLQLRHIDLRQAVVLVHQHQGVRRVIDGPGIVIGGEVQVQVDLGDDLCRLRLRVGLGIGQIAGLPVQAAVFQRQTIQQPGCQPHGPLPQPGPQLLRLLLRIAQSRQLRQGGAIASGRVRLIEQRGQPLHRRHQGRLLRFGGQRRRGQTQGQGQRPGQNTLRICGHAEKTSRDKTGMS